MILESKLTNSVQSKRKIGKAYQNQLKLPLTNPPTIIESVQSQKISIALISIMITSDLKV